VGAASACEILAVVDRVELSHRLWVHLGICRFCEDQGVHLEVLEALGFSEGHDLEPIASVASASADRVRHVASSRYPQIQHRGCQPSPSWLVGQQGSWVTKTCSFCRYLAVVAPVVGYAKQANNMVLLVLAVGESSNATTQLNELYAAKGADSSDFCCFVVWGLG
jgi:hypothetical protein